MPTTSSSPPGVAPTRGEAAAYFLWPLAWVGAPPDNIYVSVGPGEYPPEPPLGQFWNVIVTAELPDGLRDAGDRDGMFVLTSQPGAPLPPDEVPDFDAVAQVVVRRVTLMNAHLACVYTAVIRGQRYSTDPTAQVHMARYRSTYPSQVPLQMDYRLCRTFTVGTDEVNESFRLLQRLLTYSSSTEVLPLAELLLRSAAALSRHNYSIALILAWAVTEALLGELWERYLDDTKVRPGDGEHPFMAGSGWSA
jgi:hypothetical protein